MLAASSVRQAQIAVTINGTPVAGVTSANLSANAYLCADRFTVTVAYQAGDVSIWSAVPLLLDVQIGLNGAWQSLMTGYADSLDIDPVRQELTLHGRDLTSLLISAETAETFENQTASAIAADIAGRHGLTPNVAATTDLVGRYFQTGRTRSVLSQHSSTISEWDVLTWLGQREGFDVWVAGTSLNFQPPANSFAELILAPGDCTAFRIHRSLDLAAGATVVVRSWDSVQAQSITGSATSGGSNSAGTTFTTLRPNLSSADATQLAQRTLAELTTHAIEVECDMPGELSLMPRMNLNVTGTGTGFDGTYQIAEVERRLSFHHGFTQTVVARGMPWTAS